MGEKTIALTDLRAIAGGQPMTVPDAGALTADAVLDRRGRPLRDLRISVTDRCNFRCSYCMPKEVFDRDHRFLPHVSLLSFEEITRIARVFTRLGVRKLRLTGGEPLMRKDLEVLVAQLAALRDLDGQPLDLTLTTNGSMLARKAKALRRSGLQRITVSLDALDDAVFQRMNDVGFPVHDVLAGIDAALDAGFGPVKINMVVKKGTNDTQIVPLAHHVRQRYGSQAVLRFIEYMDVGSTNGWRMDEVMPSDEVRACLHAQWPLAPLQASACGETATRWRYADGLGEVGFISSVTQAFCGDCNRVRLSTEGQLFLCLFAAGGHDLRALMRQPQIDDEQLALAIASVWQRRQDHYSELRARRDGPKDQGERRVEMHYIGG
jgi:GTP 3',8-cyclase